MRVDNDEIRSSTSPRQSYISRLEWLGIITIGVMLGGLLHDGARLLIANAVAKYQIEQIKAQQERLTKQYQQELATENAAKQQAAASAERARKLNSDQCQFWLQQNQLNPYSDKAFQGVMRHCQM